MKNGIVEVIATREGWEIGQVSFKLPDGQQIDVMARLNQPGEFLRKRWEVNAWAVSTDGDMIQRVASFEIPLDTSVYPA